MIFNSWENGAALPLLHGCCFSEDAVILPSLMLPLSYTFLHPCSSFENTETWSAGRPGAANHHILKGTGYLRLRAQDGNGELKGRHLVFRWSFSDQQYLRRGSLCSPKTRFKFVPITENWACTSLYLFTLLLQHWKGISISIQEHNDPSQALWWRTPSSQQEEIDNSTTWDLLTYTVLQDKGLPFWRCERKAHFLNI